MLYTTFIILTTPGHTGVTYELCGAEKLSLSDMVSDLEQNFGREIKVETIKDEVNLMGKLEDDACRKRMKKLILKLNITLLWYKIISKRNQL